MSETLETLEIVSFSAGACRFAVEARQVEALSDATPTHAVDVETLLGLPVQSPGLRRCLRSAGRELRVSEPLALRALPVELIFPLPELVERRMRLTGVRAVALEPDGATLLLDLPALLAQDESDPDKHNSNHNDMPRSQSRGTTDTTRSKAPYPDIPSPNGSAGRRT